LAGSRVDDVVTSTLADEIIANHTLQAGRPMALPELFLNIRNQRPSDLL
jgi:hypothetical protein